jgi:hypothetical protein
MRKLLFGFVWFAALYVAFCAGVGGFAGAKAGARYTNKAEAQKAGGIAGGKAVSEYLGLIVGAAVALSILGSGFGVLPGTGAKPKSNSQPSEREWRTHKTVAEAYGSPTGLGLFDLIPGIRDLPDPVRWGLMLVVVTGIAGSLMLGPTLYKLYQR